ncbi:MAG: hypothetical protein P8Y36_09085, partial [Alphaproteobacteria bacterium]
MASMVAEPSHAQVPGNSSQTSQGKKNEAGKARKRQPGKISPAFKDDIEYQRSAKLLAAIAGLLKDAAEQRAKLKTQTGNESYIIPPLWKKTREDRERNIREVLDATLAIVTDAPVVRLQQELAAHRKAITMLREKIASLRERRMHAPRDGFLPGVLTETQETIDASIEQTETDIKRHKASIVSAKRKINTALKKAGLQISDEQLSLLLDSVLGGDFIKLVTAFQAARGIDERLGELLVQSKEDSKAARRYFAMHAALFAMIVHAQDALIDKIDTIYLGKLNTITEDIYLARDNTTRLLSEQNRRDQLRALEANAKAQALALKVALYYR